MDQKEFNQLLKKYLRGNVSEEERALIENWYLAIEHTSAAITETEKAVIEKRLQSALTAYKKTTGLKVEQNGGIHGIPGWGSIGLRIAASTVIILVVTSVFIFINYSVSKSDLTLCEKRSKLQKIENTTSSAHLITLQDGSEIILEAGALLEYPMHFDSLSREVMLKKGSAFFRICRDENRPFYVYSHDVVTRVLGTSFTINSDRKGHVTVAVQTGSVSVTSRLPETKGTKASEIILTPNQRAAYDPQHNKIVRTLVEKPRVVIPPQEVRNMTFEKASIAAIFNAVEMAYQVKIRFDAEKLSSCVLTTYLIPEEDLYTRLKIICNAIGATYTVEDGNVIINGKGC